VECLPELATYTSSISIQNHNSWLNLKHTCQAKEEKKKKKKKKLRKRKRKRKRGVIQERALALETKAKRAAWAPGRAAANPHQKTKPAASNNTQSRVEKPDASNASTVLNTVQMSQPATSSGELLHANGACCPCRCQNMLFSPSLQSLSLRCSKASA
jgi:hypothetical protein